jgi:hypothetical protein
LSSTRTGPVRSRSGRHTMTRSRPSVAIPECTQRPIGAR